MPLTSALRRPVLAACVPLIWLSACATTQVDAQWSDAQLIAGRSLHSEKVLVACDAYEAVVKRICQDQLVAEAVARGVTPVLAPELTPSVPWRPATADQYLSAARASGAKVIWTSSVTPGIASAKSGLSIGFGLGSFGSSVGGGVGVSAPIGGGQIESSYTADHKLTDVASGRLMWTAKVTAPASSDVNKQMDQLAKAAADAAQKSGLL